MTRLRSLLAVLAVVATACSSTPSTSSVTAASPEATTAVVASPAPTSAAATDPTAPATATAPDEVAPEPTPAVNPFDAAQALRFATDLAAMGPRPSGSDGDAAAQQVVADALRAAGWEVLAEEVALPQGGTTSNLVAVRDAADLERPHVVVGGHLDTVGGPGANDNASGVAAIVAIAAEWRDEPAPVPVVFVVFGAEEYQPSQPRQHHLGSAAYVTAHRDRVLAAAIVDMVGNGDRHCICWLSEGPRTMADRYLAAAEAEGLGDLVAVEARGDISDHGPFARAGIPAAFLWSYDDGRLHTTADTADHLDVADLDRAGRIALAFVRSLAAADSEALRASP